MAAVAVALAVAVGAAAAVPAAVVVAAAAASRMLRLRRAALLMFMSGGNGLLVDQAVKEAQVVLVARVLQVVSVAREEPEETAVESCRFPRRAYLCSQELSMFQPVTLRVRGALEPRRDPTQAAHRDRQVQAAALAVGRQMAQVGRRFTFTEQAAQKVVPADLAEPVVLVALVALVVSALLVWLLSMAQFCLAPAAMYLRPMAVAAQMAE